MSEVGPVIKFLGRVAYEFQLIRPLLPTYVHLLISAIFPIYTAAHASLSRPPSAAPKPKKKNDKTEESEEISQRIETLTPSDAVLFPLLAGGTLASLYFILKWLQDPSWLNWILGLYFSQIGLFFAMKFLKDSFTIIRSSIFPTQYSANGCIWVANSERHSFSNDAGDEVASPFPGFMRYLPLPLAVRNMCWKVRGLLYAKAQLEFHLYRLITVKMPIDILDLLSLVGSCIIVGYHAFISKPWYLTNFLGFSFCYGSLQFMSPGTGWTGTLILSALFFYDIYFVFFTPMMVTVATKLDVPIKLLFPRPDGCIYPVGAPEGSSEMEDYLQCIAKKRAMAMLGLGDIVVPGMMLAFALRFDLYLYYLRKTKLEQQSLNSKDSEQKAAYSPATGNWGERFWTISKLQSEDLRAKHFPKPYFYATIVGYLAGMITTVVVMQVFAHAQPALLYLVPGVLFSLWGTAFIKGDLKLLWQYSEVGEDSKLQKKGEAGSKTEIGQIESAEGETTERVSTQESKNIQNGNDQDTPEKSRVRDKVSSNKSKAHHNDRRLLHFSVTLGESKPKAVDFSTKISDLTQSSNGIETSNSWIDVTNEGRTTGQHQENGDAEPSIKRRRKA